MKINLKSNLFSEKKKKKSTYEEERSAGSWFVA
jgi:hypothetical protein